MYNGVNKETMRQPTICCTDSFNFVTSLGTVLCKKGGGGEAYFMLQIFFFQKNVSKKLKLRLKNTIKGKILTYASETWTLTKRERKQSNIFERKVYRRILGPVHDKEKENLRILTNKEIYASVKNLL
jgi:hypothetical protein